jgi:LacI family transcriptional regulator
MGKAPTVYDVAERAGVSIATVSFTFTKPEKVASATRAAVLAAAHELGYLPNASARGLAKGRTGVLGFWSYDYGLLTFAGPEDTSAGAETEPRRDYPIFIDEVQRGFQLESWRRGYAMLVHGGRTEDSDVRIRETASRVDGLAALPRTVSRDVLRELARRIPIVAISEAPDHDDDGLSYVTSDNASAMQALTAHLLDTHGFDDLVFVGSGSTDFDSRFTGFRTALAEHRLPAPGEPLGGSGAARLAHQSAPLVQELASSGRLPRALVCASDQHALVVMDALRRSGVEVPRQVAVTGFDGLQAGAYVQPALTTVRQPMQEMGRAAVGLIIELMGLPRSAPSQRLLLASELLVRHSCGC